ncbi:hypothetical protein F511_00592 [Dorcoceras hygrometricum]|nr:hypothetical protein F511_00592 [Dorcoceras hygrometricum]
MDVWFVAAAAGAGYLAQRLKNINNRRHRMLSTKNLNVVKQEVPAVLPKIQDNQCQLYRVLSSEHLSECECSDKESACQAAFGAELVSSDEFQGEILAEDSSSLSIFLRNIEGNCDGRGFVDDITNDTLPQPSTKEMGFSYDFRRTRSSIRSRKINRQLIKPRTSLEGCVMAQLFKEVAEIEENVSSVNLSNKRTMWRFHMSDESSLISRACSAACRCKLLKATRLEENNDVLGVPRLPKAVPMELQQSTKARTGKKHTLRRNDSSTMINGNHRIEQGSFHGALLFYLGLTMGMVSSFLENKRETEKLNKLLKHKENLVQDLQEELEMKDSLTVKELAVEDYESQDYSCDHMAEDEPLSKIEAELEAELERLESNMNSTRFEAKLSNITELDPDFESDDNQWGLKADLFDAKKDTRPYTNREGISTPSAQYPVSPRDLSLRLYEVIQSRLEERVVELETALANSQRKNIIGTSSSHESLVPQNEQKSVVLNLSGETLAAYTKSYEELMKVESDEEDFPFPFEDRNSLQDTRKNNVDTVQNSTLNVCLESSNGYIEPELNVGNLKIFDSMNDVVSDSREEIEDAEEEMERLVDKVCRNPSTDIVPSAMVNVPKTKKTYCKSKECKKHTLHKVTQYKKGKDSLAAQGKRRYDRKQSGYGGQTKPVFHKKAKTTKKIVLRLQCQGCKHVSQHAIKRCKHFEIGGDKKGKGTSLF